MAFCRHITEPAGVTAIPVSAFYERRTRPPYARFAFCKRDEVLDEAVSVCVKLFVTGPVRDCVCFVRRFAVHRTARSAGTSRAEWG